MSGIRKWTVFIALMAGSSATLAANSRDIALVDGTVYASPNATPLEHSVVLIRNGKINAVGGRSRVNIPANSQVIDCAGKVIVAGFWNSHVHFMEDAWDDASHEAAAKLEAHMQEMLTRWGFTTVFDIASLPKNTLGLRKRVETGEIPGPKIYTTAGEIYPKGGIPVYLPEKIARQLTSQEAVTPEDAALLARQEMDLGGDGVKIFAGAIIHGRVLPMDVSLIKAAVAAAHAHGKPVFAHPSNHLGTDNALAGGVDVLAHLIPMESDWTADELGHMKQQHTAVIPTLAMFMDEERKFGGSDNEKRMVLENALRQLKGFIAQGGTVLFGTDVGYTQVYDTTTEYQYMTQGGMSWRDILASLTTSPSGFFKSEDGRVENGMTADLVVLDADPAADVRNFAKVAYTIRAGKVIYSSSKDKR